VSFKVLDSRKEGVEITVGSRVLYADNDPATPATVIAISEPDGDYDDELQRGVEYPPKITLLFENDTEYDVVTYNATEIRGPYWPEEMIYCTDDLKVRIDFEVSGGGSLYTLLPLTEVARQWVEEHLPEDRMTFGKAVVVEHRYIEDIVRGAQADGMVVV
jgi:hypothetical protein